MTNVLTNPKQIEKRSLTGPSSQRLSILLRQNGLVAFFVLLLIVFAFVNPQFLSQANVRSILLSASVIGILAVGQTVVILTGGFDLSVAKMAVVSGLILALTASNPAIAILAALGFAAVVGSINGTLIAKAKVNPFVVTLGMMTILTSVALLVNNGGQISDIPQWILSLTSGQVLGFPSIIFWFVAIAVVLHLVMAYSRFGRHVYAVGGNPEASRLAGVKVDRVLTSAYVLAAVCAGVAGILLTSRLQTASPVALPGAELDAIAAVIIGGTRLSGGFGSIPRTVLGVLILSALSSGLVLLGVAAYWQDLVKGAVIILAVAVDVLFNRRK
ncbi:ABC transporter permease [Arthrobacter sp. NPDC056691]|uniref:ABC transporter permease n=1 Tax=Arthrobacter sp. NPDC056691 TaxID=3345913 RepID=UPI00366C0FD2